MNLKLSIRKQKHFNSLITVRDLGLIISIKSSNYPAEKEHGGVFSDSCDIIGCLTLYQRHALVSLWSCKSTSP